MILDKQAVAKIAKLARIDVTEEDKAFFSNELSRVLGWVEQLNEVDTENVPQMTSVCDMQLPLRKDEVTDGNQQEKVLMNASQSEHGCFVVPKVIE